MRTHAIAVLLLVQAGGTGCSAGSTGVDGAGDVDVDAALADAPALDAALTLTELCVATQVAWWNEVKDLDRSCSSASDCWPIGFVRRSDGLPTCGCAHSVSGRHGMLAVRAAPYAATRARELETTFYTLCAERGDLPLGEPRCEEGWPDVSCVEERCEARPNAICRPG